MKRLLVVAVTAACGASSAYRTTRIAPAGKIEWLVGAQVSGARTAGVDDDGAAPLPELAIAARRGLGQRLEIQLNGTLLPTRVAQTGSVELAGKVRLVERARYSIAVGAASGYRITHAGGAVIEGVHVAAPVMGGIELGRHQLVVSVDAGLHRLYSSGARPVNVPFIGQSIGFRWQIARTWALLPELGTAWTPARNFMSDDSRLFHVGVAALWTR